MMEKNTRGIYLAGIILLAVITIYVISTARRSTLRASKEISTLPTTIKFGGETMPGTVFRGIETTRSEKDPELIAEIKKVIDQKGTPSEVFKKDVSESSNIAVTLNELFHAYQASPGNMPSNIKVLRDSAPQEADWRMPQETLTKLAEILPQFEPKRQAMRQKLDKPDTFFYFLFQDDPDLGEVIDSDASSLFEDYLLLEEYAIGQALMNGNLVEALNSLVYILSLARMASEAGLPTVRSDAALIRMRAMDIMQTVVLDPKFNKRYLTALYEMLREQLVQWTPDSKVWITDRACNMKVYHRILKNGLEGALTPEEIRELTERDLVLVVQKQKKDKWKDKSHPDAETEVVEEKMLLNKNFLQSHVADEIFYLKSMQTIIDVSEKPFYKRLPDLDKINNTVLAKKDMKDDPIIADLLLRGIVPLMRMHAQDRAGCEIAFEAMGISLSKPAIMSLVSNPFSADPYEVNEVKDAKNSNRPLIQVSFPGCRRPFQVPDYRK